jgi:hypothetical protein
MINREHRAGLEAADGRIVHNPATLPREHRRQEELRHSQHRFHVQPHHREIFLERDFPEMAMLPVPRVVDQDLNGHTSALQLVEDLLWRVRILKILRDHDRFHAGFRAELLRHLKQFLLHPRN